MQLQPRTRIPTTLTQVVVCQAVTRTTIPGTTRCNSNPSHGAISHRNIISQASRISPGASRNLRNRSAVVAGDSAVVAVASPVVVTQWVAVAVVHANPS